MNAVGGVVRSLVVCLIVWLSVGAASADYNNAGVYNGSGDLPKQGNWLSWLDDDSRIRDISIPGTHDSGARYGATAYSKNQSLSIAQQLNAGIRFLDIRLRHIENAFAIHHDSVFQQMMFGAVLRDVSDFLRANPSEFVLLRVKEEYEPEKNTRTFEQTFNYYKTIYSRAIWNPVESNPRLADVRGRMVFLQDFPNNLYPMVGLNYYSFNIQDQWNMGNNDQKRKAGVIAKQISLAQRLRSNVINYLSVSTAPTVPVYSASVINNTVNGYLQDNVLNKSSADRYIGILPMDYPGPGIIGAVIHANNVACDIAYFDAKTSQLVTCFGQNLTALTKHAPLAVTCDGNAVWSGNSVVCYVKYTNTLKPVTVALQSACSVLVGFKGRYLSCDNSFEKTHTAPVISCNGRYNQLTGQCSDFTTAEPKKLDLSCAGAALNLPTGAIGRLGCSKPSDTSLETSFEAAQLALSLGWQLILRQP